jgi:squalene-associated FAD-dependent desaturase
MKLAVIGAGWAGMTAAVQATLGGHHVTVFEAARTLGGRARALPATLPDGQPVVLDNGQHILIGAYTETLRLMRQVGIDPGVALQRLPLTLKFPDGAGIVLPAWPSPLDALAGIARTRGWPLRERLGLLLQATLWQFSRFRCEPGLSVAQLCRRLGPRLMQELIEPLCVSALNTPAERASAQVFLRVIQDALFGVQGGSQLLLPRLDLGALFPDAAAQWLQNQGAQLHTGARVTGVQAIDGAWQVNGQGFDAVVLATSSVEAARLVADLAAQTPAPARDALQQWADTANAMRFEAITTVYAWAHHASLPHPMLALRCQADTAPAQFAFDRGRLGGPAGLLAFVVSASSGERDALQAQVLRQARDQLGLDLLPVQTVVEKRATFACTPGLQRPAPHVAPGLLACGDYVAGPYPATLEGAVRSALAAVAQLPSPIRD